MNIPFTGEQFFGVFSQYNTAIWPMQVVAYFLGAGAVLLAFVDTPIAGRAICAVLGAFWLWMGAVYHIGFFSVINAAARVFGALFILQGLLLLYVGTVQARISFAFSSKPAPLIGAASILYGMAVYPLLGIAFGHHYPAAPIFGVAPCPTAIFTFGVLLWATSAVPLALLPIPFLWSLIGMSAAVSLRVPQDYGLVVAGVLGTTLILLERRRGRLSGAREA